MLGDISFTNTGGYRAQISEKTRTLTYVVVVFPNQEQ